MNWKKKEAKFTYNGKPVCRVTMSCITPLGEFKVYESVGGNVFYMHPFLFRTSGLKGFDSGSSEFSAVKSQCKSIEDGITMCENKWLQVKNAVLKV